MSRLARSSTYGLASSTGVSSFFSGSTTKAEQLSLQLSAQACTLFCQSNFLSLGSYCTNPRSAFPSQDDLKAIEELGKWKWVKAARTLAGEMAQIQVPAT